MRLLPLLVVLACSDNKLGVYNTAPEVTITRPTAGQALLDLDAVVLEALVHDAQSRNDELTFVLSDPSGPVDVVPELPDDETVRFQLPALAPGEQVWTLLAVDPEASSGEDTIVFSVIDGDADGDGHVSVELGGDDCDDTNADVGPSAPELCNDRDDDCDGEIDEDPVDPDTWYTDADGDTFGDLDAPQYACDMPAGTVADATDCDDGDPAIYPGADELCNGVDDDCDGEIDEDDAVDATSWYPDADGDGYGAGAATSVGCDAVGEGVPTNDDCADRDPSINPGAEEVCDNGIDEDCTGVADDGCPIDHCGYITADETWSADSPHRVTCDLSIAGSASPTLTIEDGALVEVDPGYGIFIGSANPGALVVEGVSAGVLFTSSADSPAPGDWDGLFFGTLDASDIVGATIEYAGGNGGGALYANYSSAPVFTGVTVRDSATAGLYALYASPTLVDSSLLDNAGDGADLSVFSTFATFSGNTASGNGGHPVSLPATALDALDATSTYVGNAEDSVAVAGYAYVTDDATWSLLDVPYTFEDTVLIGGTSSPTVVIEPGVELRFDSDAALVVGSGSPGTLSAVGTAADPIVFTSAEASPAAGDWPGITCGASVVDAEFSYVEILYGGANGAGNLLLYYCNATVFNATIQHSSTWGIYRNGSSGASITGVTYGSNASGDLY
jgi:hypothetical protein